MDLARTEWKAVNFDSTRASARDREVSDLRHWSGQVCNRYNRGD